MHQYHTNNSTAQHNKPTHYNFPCLPLPTASMKSWTKVGSGNATFYKKLLDPKSEEYDRMETLFTHYHQALPDIKIKVRKQQI